MPKLVEYMPSTPKYKRAVLVPAKLADLHAKLSRIHAKTTSLRAKKQAG
ncbi:hypothetical protein [Salibacterium halotolerans]|nr:hypothetical protein [Salibacterium halotolerans]